MTIGDLIAAGWTPEYYPMPRRIAGLRLFGSDVSIRFFSSGDLHVVEVMAGDECQGRESEHTARLTRDEALDAALAKLCARQHSSGVTLGEFLRGLNSPPKSE